MITVLFCIIFGVEYIYSGVQTECEKESFRKEVLRLLRENK